jgi:carboxyl-terminal processing protease
MNYDMNPVPKKLNIWLPLLFSLVLVGGMLLGTRMQNNPPTVAAIEMPKKEELPPSSIGQGKLEELIRYIESRYVDDVNKDEMVKEAIDNILFQLDPHSSYISAEQLKEVNNQLEGSFDGIGIEFIVVDDTVMVVNAIPGGPAEKAGILPGDKIVTIEDSLCIGDNIDQEGILSRLKGEKGSKIHIGIRRGDEKAIHNFTLTRDKIPVQSIEVAYMLDEKTGFIKILRFSANTYEEFMHALEDLVDKQGMKDLIIDLRGNPGGYLQEATNILSQLFTEKDKLLVYTEGNNVPRTEYKTTGRNFYEIGNIGILVDENSASASEIMAGAIQDWDRGIIVGRRTFGKGLVQEQYKLRDGSAIRLTVARYYTPSNRCIQKDYESREAYEQDLADRFENGEYYDENNIHFADTTKFFTKGGRVVYGGGGIQPDIFVPLDSVQVSSGYLKYHQYVSTFTFRYLENHRNDFKEMDIAEFVDNFKVDENMLNDFLRFATDRGAKKNDRQWRQAKNEIRMNLKASLARQLWSEKGYFSVMNKDDHAVIKALNYLKKDTPLTLRQ